MHSSSRAALAAALALLVVPASASAATKIVGAGPPLKKPPAGTPQYADATQFYNATTTIHAGDSVKWKFYGFHTVYFPKAGARNVPLAGPDPTRKNSDSDLAGQPFWFNSLPQLVANPKAVFRLGGKSENGRRANGSGLPLKRTFTYTLKFPKPGSYTYFCTIHPGMKAKVKVVGKGATVPSVAADKKTTAKQIAATIAEVKRNDKRADVAGNVIEMGRDSRRISLLHFYPAQKTVPVGTTVDFRMTPATNEVHTIAFGSDAVLAKGGYAEQLSKALLAPLPGTGQGGPPVLGFPGPLAFPSDPGPLSFDGTQHGGFVNSGLLGGQVSKPLPGDTKVTFPTAGTYNYICLIHPEMKGQIVVQ